MLKRWWLLQGMTQLQARYLHVFYTIAHFHSHFVLCCTVLHFRKSNAGVAGLRSGAQMSPSRTGVCMHQNVAELKSCAAQATAASARKEAAAVAAAAEERAQAADTAAASLRARLDQTGAELAYAIASGQESAKVS